MGIRKVQVGICDGCLKDIDLTKPYVDAMVYGAAFHVDCFDKLSPANLARYLDLDVERVTPQGLGEPERKSVWLA